VLILIGLELARPDRVRAFGQAFDTAD
jgi:hypothetical protein